MSRFIFLLYFGLLRVGIAHADSITPSPKLTLRTGFGSFQNTGTNGGSAAGVGGFDLQYIYFMTPRLAVGFGYGAQFDLKQGSIPLGGFEIVGRTYFWNEGTAVTHSGDWGRAVTSPTWSGYFVEQYSMRKFYLGPDRQSTDPSKSLAGDYTAINLGAGADYRLNRNFGLNAEFSTSFLTLSSSDSRVKISESIIWLGINYIF